MDKYFYDLEVASDALEYIKSNYTKQEIRQHLQTTSDRDEWAEELHDKMWVADEVTGNASGSYYCNAWKAEEALCHNLDLLHDALEEFGCSDVNILEKGAEWADVSIRCYLLGQAISQALDNLEEDDDYSSGLTLDDLTYDELAQLKQQILTDRLAEQGEEPSYEQLCDFHDLVSDEELHDRYDGTTFVADDFVCNL